MSSLTVQEQVQKRKELAKYTSDEFQDLTKVALRKLAVGLVPNVGKLSKVELIDAILATTESERLIAAYIPEASPEIILGAKQIGNDLNEVTDTDLGTWVKVFYQDFRQTVIANWNGNTGTWAEDTGVQLSSLGYRITNYLSTRRNFSTGEYHAVTTQLRNRSHIHNALKTMVAQEGSTPFYPQLSSSLEMVIKATYVQMTDKANQKKSDSARGLAERKSDKMSILFQPFLDYADVVLSDLDNLKSYDWKSVSIALAIVTGRRCNELHTITTTFTQVDDYSVSFVGQSKAKGRASDYYEKNPAYTIPTLISSDKVCKGLQWLKDNEKQVDTAERAHKRYSKDLSEAISGLRIRVNVTSEKLTYKALRTLYAQACLKVYKPQDDIQYLAGILGHGRGNHEAAASGKYQDMITPQSYNSDFLIADKNLVLVR